MSATVNYTYQIPKNIMKGMTSLLYVRNFVLISFLFCSPLIIQAQTILEQGDLVVIGVNASNGACGDTNGDDLISFVCFKDILPNTQIDITDNGWERLLPNTWGNSEGFVRVERIGDTIPAGTVITFRLPGIGGSYGATAPDTSWSFTRLNALGNNVNMNNGGDQVFFLQGGVWNNGSAAGVGGFSQDATYTGGRILFGFNTTTTWDAFQDNSQDSGLPVEIANCYNMSPTSTNTDFISFAGPLDPVPQLEWVSRIGDPLNWQSYSDCSTYVAPPANIAIAPSNISLTCSVCNSCGPVEETIIFNLPTVGGPFEVFYSIGQDTFQLNGLENQDSISIQVDTTSNFNLISVSDTMGCPAFSGFGGGFTTTIEDVPTANSISALSVCAPPNGLGTFDLSAQDTLIKGNSTGNVSWFLDDAMANSLTNPSSFSSPDTSVFAVLREGNCSSPVIQVDLDVLAAPTFNYTVNGNNCDTTCYTIDLSFEGRGPFILLYAYSFQDSSDVDTLISLTNTRVLDVCPADFPNNLENVSLSFHYLRDLNCEVDLDESLTVSTGGPVISDYVDTLCTGDSFFINNMVFDEQNPSGIVTIPGGASNGCDSVINVSLRFESVNSQISEILCEGESLLIEGTVFDERNPQGTVIIENGASNGCDSIINVSLIFQSPVLGGLSGPSSICPGESALLGFDLQGATDYTVELIGSDGTSLFLTDVQDSTFFEVSPTETTTYTLVRVQAEGSDCVDESGSSVTIEVGELDISINQLSNYGGFGVSCAEARDGELLASVSGTTGSVSYSWNTGDTTQALRDLGPGTYQLMVSSTDGCTGTATYELEAPEALSLSIEVDTALCPGDDSRLLIRDIQGGTAPYEYTLDGLFYNAIDQLPFADNQVASGSYNLIVRDLNNCEANQLVSLIDPQGLSVNLGSDRSIEVGDSIVLTAETTIDPSNVTWVNAEDGTFLNPLELRVRPEVTTTYSVSIESPAGCTFSDFVTVFVEQTQSFYAPTGFTPNEDGFNDRFTLFAGNRVSQFNYLRIYNRWGALLFEIEGLAPNDEINGWDGTYNTELAPAGIYLYSAEMQLANGKTEVISGDFMLLR